MPMPMPIPMPMSTQPPTYYNTVLFVCVGVIILFILDALNIKPYMIFGTAIGLGIVYLYFYYIYKGILLL